MGVRGDFTGLEDLRRRFAAMSGGGFREDVARACAEAATKLIDDEFRESRSPYGQPWAPLVLRPGGKPLADTGAHLRSTLTPKADSTGFTVSTPFKGAAVHQYGAVIRAKTSRGLRFRGKSVRTTLSGGKSGPLKKPKLTYGSWITKQQVTIPQRQYMPEGDLGPIWARALNDAATDAMLKLMEADF